MSYPLCQHIKTNGVQCGSPALRGLNHCYFHHQQLQSKSRKPSAKAPVFDLPTLEDANAIQVAVMEITRALLHKRLDPKRAGLLLYALQIASANMKRVDFEPYELIRQAERANAAPAPQRTTSEVMRDVRNQIVSAAPALLKTLEKFPPSRVKLQDESEADLRAE